MHKTLKILIALSVVLIIIGGAGSLLTANSVTEADAIEHTKVIDADGITDIQVEAVNEAVSIEAADDNEQAKMEWTGKTMNDKERLSVEVNNGQLSIEMDSEPFYLFSLGTDLKDMFNKRELIVSLPEQTYSNINVNNTNGKVNLNNLKASDVRVDMTNGQLNMKNIDAEVTGNTVNGEIIYITPDLDRDIDLSTTNGRITVQTKQRPANALIDAHADVGSVSLFDGQERKTVYGDGDHHIKLTTTTGLIKVEVKDK